MRQHAIPQNILDVEFKLFTKFTLKEFAYLAIGVGFGGLMIYLTVSEVIPGIIGIPIFIISSLIGIILALVPINDQDADVFIKNYITAITSPTQRVWMNKEMKSNIQKPDVKPGEDGRMVHKDVKVEKKKIIGVGLEATEAENLDDNTEDMLDQELVVSDDLLQTSKPLDPSSVFINPSNISNYQFDISNSENLPGNINIWLCTREYKPVPNVIGYLKSAEEKVLYANKTGPNGYFLTNKNWEAGTYTLEFQHPSLKFPNVKLQLTGQEKKLPIKISEI